MRPSQGLQLERRQRVLVWGGQAVSIPTREERDRMRASIAVTLDAWADAPNPDGGTIRLLCSDLARLLDALDATEDTPSLVTKSFADLAEATRWLVLAVLREPERAVDIVGDWVVDSDAYVDDDEVMVAVDRARALLDGEGSDGGASALGGEEPRQGLGGSLAPPAPLTDEEAT